LAKSVRRKGEMDGAYAGLIEVTEDEPTAMIFGEGEVTGFEWQRHGFVSRFLY
jgi:hypothetical protein